MIKHHKDFGSVAKQKEGDYPAERISKELPTKWWNVIEKGEPGCL